MAKKYSRIVDSCVSLTKQTKLTASWNFGVIGIKKAKKQNKKHRCKARLHNKSLAPSQVAPKLPRLNANAQSSHSALDGI